MKSSTIRVWAPAVKKVEVVLKGSRQPMRPGSGGWWTLPGVAHQHGDDYAFVLDGEGPFPDPRSPSQPQGVHAASRWVDHGCFPWSDEGWRAPPLGAGSIYELHVGTFSPEGTFAGAIGRLDHLVDLGVGFLEIMPVAAFAGDRGWGYDGVSLYAPHAAYGEPEDLKRLVDACHRRGLGVILDVVYNHLGPVGNYLPRFGPYFTDRHRTPWGEAVNLDGEGSDEVRQFFVDNALMWLRDYHFDGIRIDAVHAFLDLSATHFLAQISAAVRRLELETGRPRTVIAESDLNDPRVIRQPAVGGYGCDAQWNEDFHHALHTLLTGESFTYYGDFGRVGDLAVVLRSGFCYDGRYSAFRGRRHGASAAGLPGSRFVACLQNHDQVGNRGQGERIGHLVDPARLKLGAAIVLLGPFIPMLFQGEEWAAASPFFYFTHFDDPELAEAVREGRRSEFGGSHWDPEKIPDPQADPTFEHSKLRWDERRHGVHRELLDWHRQLLRLRRDEPDFAPGPLQPDGVAYDEETRWLRFRRGRFQLWANFSEQPQRLEAEALGESNAADLILASLPEVKMDRNALHLPAWGLAVLRSAGGSP